MRAFTGFILLASLLFDDVESASTLRIMPMGDALTTGFNGAPGGYRPRLYSKMSNEGYQIDFVGNTVSGNAQNLPDRDCEAHKKFTIADMIDHVDEFLNAYDPDVILLMMGHKDLLLLDDNFANAADRYDTLITKLSSSRPEAHIFVANLPPRKNSDQNQMIDQLFNPRIPEIVAAHIAAGRYVTFVDVHSAVPLSDLKTMFQPSEDGYAKIGDAFGDAIMGTINENLLGLARGIIRVEGGLDRRRVKITFSKPVPQRRSQINNFVIDKLNILESSLENDDRVVVLTTSEQTPGATYKVKVNSGVPGTSKMQFTVGFRIIQLSDWHLGEKYIFGGKVAQVATDIAIVQHLKSNYFGELVMIPGDTNAGFWDTDSFAQEMIASTGQNLSRESIVLEAGDRCYGGLLSTFRFGGYPNVIVAIGDHELGDNAWASGSLKSLLQPQYRQAFTSNFNDDYDGNFKYNFQIGNVSASPVGTNYAKSSYAYIHRNTLIVTVDVLHQESPTTIIGSLGTVTGAVTGNHLQWLDDVLEQGKTLPEVKHIIVQGHFPVLFPVRKTKSSGIYMDNNEESEFWTVLRKHPVDIYFAGEAHLNTVSMDVQSDIIQIVGRGNFFTNFFTIDITDDTIDITCYEETGPEKTMENFNYVASGHLGISKIDGSKSINASGELAFFDADDPVVYINFESITMLEDRPILGLGELSGVRRAPIIESVIVDGSECTESLINVGTFGQDYDAQSRNVQLTAGVYGTAGEFSTGSRAAIFGMGPHSETHPISYSMWFKTTSFGARTLLVYEGYWKQDDDMTLRLKNGEPELVYSSSQKLYNIDVQLNDGLWHHIATTMPHKGCKMSEVKMFVDGKMILTVLSGADEIVNPPNGGMLSVGSFGYGGAGSDNVLQRTGYREGLNFVGSFDDVIVFARSLSDSEIRELSTLPAAFALRSHTSYEKQEAFCLGFGLFGDDVVLRNCNDQDGQLWMQDILGYIHNKDKYEKCLIPALEDGGTYSIKVEDCNLAIDSTFAWNLENGHVWHQDTGAMLAVNTDNINEIELSMESLAVECHWDVVYEGGFAPSYLTGEPSVAPTRTPSSIPSVSPSAIPTVTPSTNPTANPSTFPTGAPSAFPSLTPSISPTAFPSTSPSQDPTAVPSVPPSSAPTKSASPTDCKDGQGKVTLTNGKTKNCSNAAKKSRLCGFQIIADHCPVTCGSCYSSAPTPSPTPAPSSKSNGPNICADHIGQFIMPNGRQKTCAQAHTSANLCNRDVVIAKCPVSCDACPSTSPPTSPPEGDTCKDNFFQVLLPNGKSKSCFNAANNPQLCKKWTEVAEHCPLVCGTCNLQGDSAICEDGEGKIILPNGLGKSCMQAQNNPSLCGKWTDIQEFCPVTCERC